MTVKSLLLAGSILLTAATTAAAGGFQVNLGGQRNIGMGGVGVGLSLDQAAMFYNPGALAMVRRNGVQLGFNGTFARSSYLSEGGSSQSELKHDVVTPFNGYASFGSPHNRLRLGIAVYTPFGSKLRYQDDWAGRYSLTQINLQSIYVQPTASFALNDHLSIGIGVTILSYGSVNLQRDIPLPSSTGQITLDGRADTKYGFNAGIYFKPSDKFSLGASYRSKIDARVSDGDVSFSGISPTFASRFKATKFKATIPLPATISAGIGVMPNEKLTLGFDANFVQWSKYQNLTFEFNDVVNNATSSTSKRDYRDALTLRLGGQYLVSEKLAVRAGTYYDFTPVKDGYITPETPDSDRISVSAGATYSPNDKFGVDLSFEYLTLMKRSQSQSSLVANGTTDRVAGTYKTTIAIPGIGAHYNF